MKRYLIVVLIIVVAISGCAVAPLEEEPNDVELATAVVDGFFSCVFDIPDYQAVASENDYYQFSLYNDAKLLLVYSEFTEFGIRELMGNRYVYRAISSAYYKKSNIKVLDIQCDNVTYKSDEGKIFLDFTVELELTASDGSVELVEKTGKIKLIKEETWKIDHILDTNKPLQIDPLQLPGNQELADKFEKASEVARQFLTRLFTVEDYQKLVVDTPDQLTGRHDAYMALLDALVTEDMKKQMTADRLISLIADSVVERQMNLSVGEIAFDQFATDQEKIYLRFDMGLQLQFQDGATETVNKRGLVQLLDDSEMRIIHYRAINYPFEILD
jgi:hypothetical protein